MEQAIAFASGDVIQPQDLPTRLRSAEAETTPATLRDAVLQAQREFVRKVVISMKGDSPKIAATLGIHPAGLGSAARHVAAFGLKKAFSKP